MNLKQSKLTVFFIIILFNLSCVPYKNVPYFQDLARDSVSTQKINNYAPLVIQPGDLLGLHVGSLNPEADVPFNYNLTTVSGTNKITSTIPEDEATPLPGEAIVYGYLVNDKGNIRLPEVGDVKVAGLTTSEIQEKIQPLVAEYLSKPEIIVRLLNFKVSILGDVKSPGTYSVPNERITLTEGLALAGDLNSTGIRTNVLLIREVDGVRKYIPFDLTSKNIFASPYYYLKNNDIIYVVPNKERVRNESTTFQKASLAVSVISVLVLILNKVN